MTQMMPPMQIAPVIPTVPVVPVTFRRIVVMMMVAMAIPDTGLLEEPIRPTIREDTVAKKKPKTTTIKAPSRFTGKAGSSQIATAMTTMATSSTGMGISCSVRSMDALPALFMPCMACLRIARSGGSS